MKKIIFLFSSLFLVSLVPAQCTIDYTHIFPGLYPSSLPDGYVNQSYSEDVTFVLPTDTLGFSFTNFEIQSISGLPFGMNWMCNSTSNGCNYDPTVSQYGCVNFFGTPLVAGTYSLDVSIIATLPLGNFPVTYQTPITIFPDTFSENDFSMMGNGGCAPATVSFINNNPGMVAYHWDFGNGVSSAAENPAPQLYFNEGSYPVKYEAYTDTTGFYYLTDITVLGIPNDYGGFMDDPDIYIELFDENNNLIYNSSVVDNVFPPVSFGIPNIGLNNEVYTVRVWDEDSGMFGSDDDLGATTFNGHSSSGTSTTSSTSISYSITKIDAVPSTTSIDTVEILGYSNVPNIFTNGNTLQTDSISLNLQWYQDGLAISGAIGPSYTATVSGEYWVISQSLYGCISSSDTIQIDIPNTRLQEINLSNKIDVFPNPNNGRFTIKSGIDLGSVSFALTDLSGRLIAEPENIFLNKNNQKEVVFNTLAPGTYLITLVSDGVRIRKKMIVN